MDVEPELPLEELRGDDHTVGGDDHDVSALGALCEPIRPGDRDAQLLGALLRRRGPKTPPPASTGVGPRQHERDLVVGGEPLEDGRPEGRGRSDDQAHTVAR